MNEQEQWLYELLQQIENNIELIGNSQIDKIRIGLRNYLEKELPKNGFPEHTKEFEASDDIASLVKITITENINEELAEKIIDVYGKLLVKLVCENHKNRFSVESLLKFLVTHQIFIKIN